MTKEGSHRHSVGMMTEQDFHKDLDHDLNHFSKDLMAHKQSLSSGGDDHLLGSLERFGDLIMASIQEIKRAGIAKEGKLFQHALDAYKKNPSEENFLVLEDILATLKEFNR